MLSVDDQAWPVREHGIIPDPTHGREFLVVFASFMRHEIEPSINYVRCEAQERKGDSTEPSGPEFPAR